MTEAAAKRLEEGLRAAAERRAALTPEKLAQVEQMEQGITELLSRAFVGPANEKGRFSIYIATPEEAAEFFTKESA